MAWTCNCLLVLMSRMWFWLNFLPLYNDIVTSRNVSSVSLVCEFDCSVDLINCGGNFRF